MKNQFILSQLFYSSKWYFPDKITEFSEYHSTAGNMIPILIIMDNHNYDYPTIGYYYAGLLNEFRAQGSPSEQFPILWTPMPVIPKKQP